MKQTRYRIDPAIFVTVLVLGICGIVRADPTTVPSSPIHKPPAGSQIDWKNPLAKGLVSAVALNEGQGITFYDAVTKESYPAQTLGGTPRDGQPPAWIAPKVSDDYPWVGPAISNNNATAQGIVSTLKDAQFIDTTTGYSYAMLVEPLDDKTFGRIMDGTGAAVITLYLNIHGREGKVSTTWRNATGKAINPVSPIKPGQWILVLCTVQDGLGVMYINGKEVARDSNVSLKNSQAGQKGQLVYNATGNGGMMCNANFSGWWIWNNRVLTAEEAAQMYSDPWEMFDRASQAASTTRPEK